MASLACKGVVRTWSGTVVRVARTGGGLQEGAAGWR